MRYVKLTRNLWSIIGLETFVFASFIGICALINALIVGIPNIPEKPFLNFVYATLKVGTSLLMVGIWLLIWYYFTKRLISPNKQKAKKENVLRRLRLRFKK